MPLILTKRRGERILIGNHTVVEIRADSLAIWGTERVVREGALCQGSREMDLIDRIVESDEGRTC